MSRPAPVPAAFGVARLSSAWLSHKEYELAAVHKAINLKSQYENKANRTSVLRLTLTVRQTLQRYDSRGFDREGTCGYDTV